MKKFIVLAIIFYYAYCVQLCGGDFEPGTNETICYEAPLDNKNNQCCLVKKENENATCHEFPKTSYNKMRELEPEFKDAEIKCKYTNASSYLVAGFILLFSMFLL